MKIQRFSGIQREFQFFPTENFGIFENRFYQSDLGKLYSAVPWKLIRDFGIREKTAGRSFGFPSQGRLALMFLKNYSGLSDKKLIEQLNGNVEWQFFCGIYSVTGVSIIIRSSARYAVNWQRSSMSKNSRRRFTIIGVLISKSRKRSPWMLPVMKVSCVTPPM